VQPPCKNANPQQNRKCLYWKLSADGSMPTLALSEQFLRTVLVDRTFWRLSRLQCKECFLWSGRSGDVTMILQAAKEIKCRDHSSTAWVGRFYILLRYLVFVFVVRFLFIRWFPCIRLSIIFWGFPHVMVHDHYSFKRFVKQYPYT